MRHAARYCAKDPAREKRNIESVIFLIFGALKRSQNRAHLSMVSFVLSSISVKKARPPEYSMRQQCGRLAFRGVAGTATDFKRVRPVRFDVIPKPLPTACFVRWRNVWRSRIRFVKLQFLGGAAIDASATHFKQEPCASVAIPTDVAIGRMSLRRWVAISNWFNSAHGIPFSIAAIALSARCAAYSPNCDSLQFTKLHPDMPFGAITAGLAHKPESTWPISHSRFDKPIWPFTFASFGTGNAGLSPFVDSLTIFLSLGVSVVPRRSAQILAIAGNPHSDVRRALDP